MPRPTTARPRNAYTGCGATSEIAFPAAITPSPASPVRRAPNRSAIRPPGICIDRCTTNCAVVKSPTVASPTPYAWESRVATAPTAVMFQPTVKPTPRPPSVARVPMPPPRSTGASVRDATPPAARAIVRGSMSVTPSLTRRKHIALIAHDNLKADLLDWARYNRGTLAKHELHATGTTGTLLAEELGLDVHLFLSGPLGGDQQIGAAIAEGRIDFVIFFWDPLEPHPHDVDVKALLRIAVVYNVPIACNRATADFVLSSPLLGADYNPDPRTL